jgi:hypothetical protein
VSWPGEDPPSLGAPEKLAGALTEFRDPCTHVIMSLITRFLDLLALAAAVVFAASCGGDGESRASFPVESGVTPTRPLTALTSDERLALCDAVATTTIAFLESDVSAEHLCTLAGALESTTLAGEDNGQALDERACERTRMECLKLPPVEPAPPPDCTTTAWSVQAPCTATIAEYQGCLEQLFETVSDSWESTTCRTFIARHSRGTLPGAGELDATQVASCGRIQRECPGLIWPSPDAALARVANRWLDVEIDHAFEGWK